MPSRSYVSSDPNPVRRIWKRLVPGLGPQPAPRPSPDVTFSHPSLMIPLSPLVRVVAVGQSANAGRIRVELIAIEIREAGALLYWRATPVNDLMLLSAHVQVSDDQGTTYEAVPAGHEGSAIHWSGHTALIPPPPRNARLTIELVSFGPEGGHPVPRGLDREPVPGPWRFTVAT